MSLVCSVLVLRVVFLWLFHGHWILVSTLKVFPVERCPEHETEVEEASERLNCSFGYDKFTNEYHCVPFSNLTQLVEFCYPKTSGLIGKGNCMLLEGDTLDARKCNLFTNGCPDTHYTSEKMYKFPSCSRIDRESKCYLALPSCPPDHNRQVSSNSSDVHMATTMETIIMDTNIEPWVLVLAIIIPVSALLCLTALVYCKIKSARKRTRENEDKVKATEMKSLITHENSQGISENCQNMEEKGPLKEKFYSKGGSTVLFAKLSDDLAENFPEHKLQRLKYFIIGLDVVNAESIEKVNSVRELFVLLQKEKLFIETDVIFMQCLFIQTGCEDLNKKCIEYATNKRALCFFEKPPDNGYTSIKFHVEGNIQEYPKEDVTKIKETVVAILGCEDSDVLRAGIGHGESFFVVLAIKERFVSNIFHMDQHHIKTLRNLKVDFFILNTKTNKKYSLLKDFAEEKEKHSEERRTLLEEMGQESGDEKEELVELIEEKESKDSAEEKEKHSEERRKLLEEKEKESGDEKEGLVELIEEKESEDSAEEKEKHSEERRKLLEEKGKESGDEKEGLVELIEEKESEEQYDNMKKIIRPTKLWRKLEYADVERRLGVQID